MALRTAGNDDTQLNRSQADYDRKFNAIAKREEAGTFDGIAKNYSESASPAQENKNIEKARRAEIAPSAGWKLTGISEIGSETSGKKKKKRKGPIIAILGVLFGAGTGIAAVLSAFSSLPIAVGSQTLDKFNGAQETSLEIRMRMVLDVKIGQDVTTGSCSTMVTVLCRYERPSNKLLKNMAREGIQAVDKDGLPTKSGTLFPNERPAIYRYTDRKTGKVVEVKAKDFVKTMNENASFRSAMRSAYNPRFISFADEIFGKIKARFGFKTSDSLRGVADGDEARDKLNEGSKGAETGAKAAAGTLDGAEEVIEKQLTQELSDLAKNTAKSGRGNAFGLVAGTVCGLGDIPGIMSKVIRAYQLTQLVKYGAAILTAINSLKASQSTPEAATALGDLFTQTIDGKSALDSFGMKYILFDDRVPANNNYKKFVPGGDLNEILGTVTNVTSSPVKKEVCRWATNPATGAAIDVATSETIVLPLINMVVGVALSIAMEQALPPIIEWVVGALKDSGVLTGVLQYFLGDLTADLLPEGAGDAFASGVAHMIGQTANAGANMALTNSQKSAYDKVSQEVQIARAEEDRATLSPFDTSSPNTMMGSFVRQLLPYYKGINSVGSVVSTLGNIVTGSLGSLVKPSDSYALKDPPRLCEDPSLKDKDIATGPFCNIEYGIPPEYLRIDPLSIVSSLVASGDIDDETGEPVDTSNVLTSFDPTQDAKGNLKGWIDICTDGSTMNADECKITDSKTASYALYVIDRRIQKTMDGEDKGARNNTGENSSETAVPPTTDARVTTVVNKKHPNEPLDYAPADLQPLGSVEMRAEAVKAMTVMQNAATGAGAPLTMGSGYRSVTTQTSVYNKYVAEDGQAEADTYSARPSYSEHQTGLAIDFSPIDASFGSKPQYTWLKDNAYKYGYVNRYPEGKQAITGYIYEPWHWRYVGVTAATEMKTKNITTLEEYFNITGGNYASNGKNNSQYIAYLQPNSAVYHTQTMQKNNLLTSVNTVNYIIPFKRYETILL